MLLEKRSFDFSSTLLIGLAIAAHVSAPAGVSAQCMTSTAAHTYVPLTVPTVIATDVDDGQASVDLPFPITYFGADYTTISVGYNGAVAFPGGTAISLSNNAPGPGGLENFVAPFWDDLRVYAANMGYIGWMVGGTAPNRTFTVEWNNISRFGATGVQLSMQVRFFEGSNQIEIDYGPITGSASFSASMGLDGPAGAGALLFAPSVCTTNCTQADYDSLASRRVTVTCLCGNMTVDAGEECDDGNVVSGDGCSGACLSEICGNSRVDGLEACDDGNTTDGDGCSATCSSDETCGNGVIDAVTGETCDDGNTTDGDGCSATCQLPCGDGVLDAGEACDDGNMVDGDGCSADCSSDETCGNTVLDMSVGELCDDGNIMAGDGCSGDCMSDETCGNGVLDSPVGEECDDGNTTEGDGCSSVCALPACGDGIVDPEEVCDDGNSEDADGCSATCMSDETCGNGVVDAAVGEACDMGIDNSDTAPDTCRTTCDVPACGDGVADTGEACDDGMAGSATCTATCETIAPDAGMPDAGSGGDAGGTTRDAGARSDGGSVSPDATTSRTDGGVAPPPSGGDCSCAAGGTRPTLPMFGMLALFGLALLRRRRR